VTADLEDLDDLVRRNDPDRWLASRFIRDPQARADVIALYAFDHELNKIAAIVKEPMMAEIRLTWWTEVLDEIFDGRPVRRHPAVLALADLVARRRLPREQLDAMIEPRFDNPASRQAGPVMRLAAFILCGEWPIVACAAEGWVEHDPEQLKEANETLRGLPARGFPAVAYATLARAKPGASDLQKRLRLLWAVLRGKL